MGGAWGTGRGMGLHTQEAVTLSESVYIIMGNPLSVHTVRACLSAVGEIASLGRVCREQDDM